MIYLSGDTHGSIDLQKVIDFFENETLLMPLTKKDYLIILGDSGICWDDGRNDAWVKKHLQELPVTTLWIDGNHENFALLEEYPQQKWHGGSVHVIKPDILHLMRGCCFEIDGRIFWVFGGGFSIDQAYRTPAISWWPREMPSMQEYQRGMDSLKACSYQVDYILTHTAPLAVVKQLVPDVLPGEEVLQQYLQNVAEQADFSGWYFGHWHMDITVDGKYHGLMEEIVRLGQM